MKRFLLIAFLLVGCAENRPHTKYPIVEETTVICESSNLLFCQNAVIKETETRFVHPIIYICHGNQENMNWIIYPDAWIGKKKPAQFKADELRRKFPHRTIVLWSCNPGGNYIKGKGIWYFRKSVWAVPDRQIPYRWSYTDFNGKLCWIDWVSTSEQADPKNFSHARGIDEAVEGD